MKGFQSKKKMVNFFNEECSVYRCTFVMQPPSTPIKCGSNGPAYEMGKKRQKIREGKRERKKERRKNAGSNHKKKKPP